MTFDEFFRIATGQAPYPYQQRLAAGAPPAVLEISTGLGKTEATVLSWLYRRHQNPKAAPRRLLYCLPMRSLVEQTRNRTVQILERLESAGINVPTLEIIMGGDVGEEWYRNPESPAIVIGTQDMLVSRALNRGYGMSRFQWPMAYAAANDDVYWVIDEVQLQGIGAVTATQLQAFRERLGTYHRSEITLASATIDPSWFETADFTLSGRSHLSLTDDDRANANVRRVLHAPKTIERAEAADPRSVAALAVDRHRPGTRTLVVVNRVSRAQDVYRQLQRLAPAAEILLLHSRFRPGDRARHAEDLLVEPPADGPGRIIVATQVVEAGIDVSAATLITDVAPWSSLVQRFGRCNRRGEDAAAACIWLDAGTADKTSAVPYVAEDLAEARESLLQLEGASAAPADLPRRSIPLRSGLVIRRPEFLDLFDTSLDLSGHDIDVSPYIRDADEISAAVFWRDTPPTPDEVSQRDELCPAPLSDVRTIVKALRAEGRGGDVRAGNQFGRDDQSAWAPLAESDIRPGITVWLQSRVGWYDPDLGFAKRDEPVEPVPVTPVSEVSERCPSIDADCVTVLGVPITLTRHAQDTWQKATELVGSFSLEGSVAKIVTTAARWHDAGKAHAVFQETMRRANAGYDGDPSGIWAKSISPARHGRRGFRHELPGALAYLSASDSGLHDDAIAYLIAAHHGKARVSIAQLPYEAPAKTFQVLGTVDGERLPGADLGDGTRSPETVLSLTQFRVGSAGGERLWLDRTIGLRDHPDFGPFRLAFLELLVRIADWRASAEEKQCR